MEKNEVASSIGGAVNLAEIGSTIINFPSYADLLRCHHLDSDKFSLQDYSVYCETIKERFIIIQNQIKYYETEIKKLHELDKPTSQNQQRDWELFLDSLRNLEEHFSKTKKYYFTATQQRDFFSTDTNVLIEKQLNDFFHDFRYMRSLLTNTKMVGYYQAAHRNKTKDFAGIWQRVQNFDGYQPAYAREKLNPDVLENQLQQVLGEFPETVCAKTLVFGSGMAAINACMSFMRSRITQEDVVAFPDSAHLYFEVDKLIQNEKEIQRYDPAEISSFDKLNPTIVWIERNSNSPSMTQADLKGILKKIGKQLRILVVDHSLAVPGSKFHKQIFNEYLSPNCTVLLVSSLQKMYQMGSDSEQGGMVTVARAGTTRNVERDSYWDYCDLLSLRTLLGNNMRPDQALRWEQMQPDDTLRHSSIIARNVESLGKWFNSLKQDFPFIEEVNFGEQENGATDSPVLFIKFKLSPKIDKFYFNTHFLPKLLEHDAQNSNIKQYGGGGSFGFRHTRFESVWPKALRIAPGSHNPAELEAIKTHIREALDSLPETITQYDG